ncbi:tRNA (adenosine(37)-N6)-threonylcarbamoyltransferase complex transferase subunit TsaD [Candidatus Kaiserbacteria bacterium]|nr:tRNA (adenosine(37)-N6)-threonylcarbamoyltransferase complex transferase subunit TsaD [Candidatus Kaiserbacteria bacterium]
MRYLGHMRILAIETSCDETGVCLLETRDDGTFHVLGNALYSQVAVHAPYGGVYPNLAKREHSVNLVPVMIECFAAAGALSRATSDIPDVESVHTILEREPELFAELASFLSQHGKPQIDAIAVTHGPGLEPALWVGVNFARALSQLWNVPIVPVNHMEGHIIMPMMHLLPDTKDVFDLDDAQYPLLALLVSGGHTELVLSKEPMHYEIIGQTRDDAAGEAFDKVARLLGLPYPGGPEISRLAALARASGESCRYVFPRPMLYSGDYDFSFSGLKTELRKHVQSLDELTDETRMHTAWAFEDAVVDTLVHKTAKVTDEHGVQTVVLGGGVSANTHLRAQLKEALDARSITLLVPPPALSTDNAVMIALAGALRAAHNDYADPATLTAHGHLRLA